MEINNRPRRQQPKFIIENNNNNKVVLPTQAYASPKHTQHKTANVNVKEKIEEVTQPLNPPLPLPPSSVNDGKSRRTQSRPVTISSSASISAHNVRATVKPPSLPSKRRKTVVNNVEDGTRGMSYNSRLADEQHETPKARRVVLPSSSTSTRVKFEDNNNKHTTSTSNKTVKYENPTYVNTHNTSISDLIDPSIASISRRNDARIIRSCNGGGVGSGVVTLPSSKKTVLNVNNNVKGEFMTFKKDRNKKDIIPDDENDKIPPIKSLTFKRSRYDAEETNKIMTSIKKAVSISAGIHTSKKKDVKIESDLKKKKIVPCDEEESKRSFNASSDTEKISSSGSSSVKNCCKIKLKEQPIIINSKNNTVSAQRFDELLEIYQNNQKYYIFNGFDERAIKKLEEWFTSIIEPCSSPKGSEDYQKWKFREKGKNKTGHSYYCDDKLIYLFR